VPPVPDRSLTSERLSSTTVTGQCSVRRWLSDRTRQRDPCGRTRALASHSRRRQALRRHERSGQAALARLRRASRSRASRTRQAKPPTRPGEAATTPAQQNQPSTTTGQSTAPNQPNTTGQAAAQAPDGNQPTVNQNPPSQQMQGTGSSRVSRHKAARPADKSQIVNAFGSSASAGLLLRLKAGAALIQH